MISVKYKVTGLRELQANLHRLDESLRGPVLRGALASALTPARRAIAQATYTTVQRRTGLLQEGIKIMNVREGRGDPNRVAAGVFAAEPSKGFLKLARKQGRLQKRRNARGKLREVREPFYWRMIEHGSERMQPRPYIARAFASSGGAVIDRFAFALRRGIDKAVAALPRTGGSSP